MFRALETFTEHGARQVRTSDLSRRVLGVWAAFMRASCFAFVIALTGLALAACGPGGTPPQPTYDGSPLFTASGVAVPPPIGAPNGMPQGRALAARGDSSSYRVLHRFSIKNRAAPSHPFASLLDVNGTLYGTTDGKDSGKHECGTAFSISTIGVTKTLYRFHGPDGCGPRGALTDVNGTLFGTTYGGGQHGYGVVFSLTTSGVEKVLYSFKGAPDGDAPVGGLVDLNGTLYGMTEQGGIVGGSNCPGSFGDYGCGTVYSVSTSGSESVLYSFKGEPDGFQPESGLIAVKGKLYGTTTSGGLYWGTVFSVTTTGSESVVYSFTGGADGNWPYAPLIDVKGTFYGTTVNGGSSGKGTVYSVTPGGSERVLYSFAGGSDGQGPAAGLRYFNGTFYGGTDGGGGYGCYSGNGCGTVYSLTLSGSENVLHRFKDGSDGAFPHEALTTLNGTLYGTTIEGGGTGCNGQGCGTVFSVTP